MASPDMSIKIYIFPLTTEESMKPHITGLKLIMNNQNRLIPADDLGYGDFNLANYDKGRNLVVYENVVYEVFKDYCDITNRKRYYMLKPILNGCEQM